MAIYNRALSVDEIRQSCRRIAVSGQQSAISCPDPREPIILTPLPGQVLPPTKAYWSWRGERDRGGKLLHPKMEYEVRFDVDGDQNGTYLTPFVDYQDLSVSFSDIAQSGDDFYHVETDWIGTLNNYRLKIHPVENSVELSDLESTLSFSTDNSVVAWWDFHEGTGQNVSDDLMSSRDLNLVGFSTEAERLWSAGIIGNGPYFDGDNYGWVSENGTAAEEGVLIPSPMTLEAWVNPDLNEGSCTVMNKTSGGNGYLLAIGADLGAGFTFGDGFTGQVNTAPVRVEGMTGWKHLAATHDAQSPGVSGNGAIYYNGNKGGTAVGPMRDAGGVGLQGPNLEIGREAAGQSYCTGVIDEIRIYKKALSPADLCNSYLAFCRSANPSAGVSCPTTCIGDQ